jgi:hypothetical protein
VHTVAAAELIAETGVDMTRYQRPRTSVVGQLLPADPPLGR